MAGSPRPTDEGHLAQVFLGLIPLALGVGAAQACSSQEVSRQQQRRQWDRRHQAASCPLTLREQAELLVRGRLLVWELFLTNSCGFTCEGLCVCVPLLLSTRCPGPTGPRPQGCYVTQCHHCPVISRLLVGQRGEGSHGATASKGAYAFHGGDSLRHPGNRTG